jgi:hypothetical protein
MMCASEAASDGVRTCVHSLDAAMTAKLTEALTRWGGTGVWSSKLLDTRSFQKRFELKEAENHCLKMNLCSEDI